MTDLKNRSALLAFGELRQELSYRIVGYVLMPEHFQALIGLRPEATPSQIVQNLEDRTALFMLFWNDASVLTIDTEP